MARFPKDAPGRKVVRALGELGFEVVREGSHIAMRRRNNDGSVTPLTLPNHARLKSSTLRAICNQSGVTRDDFLQAYERA